MTVELKGHSGVGIKMGNEGNSSLNVNEGGH